MGKNDQFGNRMKAYERCGTSQKLMYDAPVIARLDGRAFHQFCKKNFKAPYDEVFNNMMLTTTEILVKETNALIGYTQSDEITLVFNNDYNRPMLFNGKLHKLNSTLASTAADIFAVFKIEAGIYDRSAFDCRVFNVPDKEEACNVLLWREKDATRNSIFSLARTLYSHKELDNKSSSDLQEMIFQKGINWNDCPRHQKRGTYIRMETVERKYTPKEIDDLPPKHEARSNPNLVVKRREIRYMNMPPFGRVTNKVGMVFDGVPPTTHVDGTLSLHKLHDNLCDDKCECECK